MSENSTTGRERAIATAWREVRSALARVSRAIDTALVRAGGPDMAAFELLDALAAEPDEPLPMHRLADALAVSRSGLTRMVDRVERMGWVRRERSTSDHRSIHVCLTEKGRAAWLECLPAYRQALAEAFREVRRKEAEELAELLRQLGR